MMQLTYRDRNQIQSRILAICRQFLRWIRKVGRGGRFPDVVQFDVNARNDGINSFQSRL
jgi:hypothetical protein